MPVIPAWLRRAGEAISPLVTAAAGYLAELHERADAFRRLIALGGEGWAISTYGMMLAPEAHRGAATTAGDPEVASAYLEEGWSDPGVRRSICAIVPWVYPPATRGIGRRRAELLERASWHFDEGRYEEAVLLVYSQLDGLFRDRAETGEAAFSRLFSRRPVGGHAKEFADIIRESATMPATESEFFLVVRDLMTESVNVTTLDDHPSRHGVLHGRVLGYGTRRRAAQSFAFLAAALELLVASFDQLPLSRYESHEMPSEEWPLGLRLILHAKIFAPVRSVYLSARQTGNAALVEVAEEEPAPHDAAAPEPGSVPEENPAQNM